jgi:hypothetical protein
MDAVLMELTKSGTGALKAAELLWACAFRLIVIADSV